MMGAAFMSCQPETAVDFDGPLADWPDYGGTKAGTRFVAANQITASNVARLDVAWVHHSGDVSDGTGDTKRTSFQATPIMIGDTLYYCTAYNRVFALDAQTGEERWVFDPELRARHGEGPYPLTCRGVAYWNDLKHRTGECAARIFTGTRDSELIALDAITGRRCSDFGENGIVALREGIGAAPPWEYYPTSPPLTIRDLVVVGALVADNLRADAPAGVVRAFDARSGKLRWAWDPVPPDWPKGKGYQAGTPNVWSILSGDEDRGLVFVPTGNAAPDGFAASRRGLDYYSSSTVALRVEDGNVAWRFQTVHNDVWDYDVASQPTLFQHPNVGNGVAAVAQPTKMGNIFLLNRETGEPLYEVEERAVPASDVPGEKLSPTQPFPTHPPPLHPQVFGPEDAWGFTPIDRGDCEDKIRSLRSEGIYTPPSTTGSIQYPSGAGGANWGSASFDPTSGVLFVNQMHGPPQVVTLVPREDYAKLDDQAVVYPNELYPQAGTPYGMKRSPLLSNFGAPCNTPPWGTLTAVDLASGNMLWRSILGSTRDAAPWPLWFDLGAPNLGGSIVTAGGVVFIAATLDKFFRGFDAKTGEEIWKYRIPYTGNSTPMSYRVSKTGKQFVVLAAGGHGWSEPGDALMAFTLQ